MPRPPKRSRLFAAAFVAGLALSSAASAVSLGQVDDFEDGTTQGWKIGPPGEFTAPQQVGDGGPDGAGDAYLLLTSVGSSGPGSRLTAINDDQWAGDYTAAGITAVTLSARNPGATDLALRLSLASLATSSRAISTQALLLPSGSDWVDLVFPILPGDLTPVMGEVASALSSVWELRILHGATTSFPPDPIVASLGIDDVQAVPEPGTGALLGLALAGLTRLKARSRPAARRESARTGRA